MIDKIVRILLISVLLAIVVIALLTLAVFDNRKMVRPEFNERRAQWEAADINHYRATIRAAEGNIFCAPSVKVEVEGGEVILAEPIYHPEVTPPSDFASSCEQQHEKLTIDYVIEVAARYLEHENYSDTPIWFSITYHPTYGFPIKVSFRANISHMPYYEINDFKVLP